MFGEKREREREREREGEGERAFSIWDPIPNALTHSLLSFSLSFALHLYLRILKPPADVTAFLEGILSGFELFFLGEPGL